MTDSTRRAQRGHPPAPSARRLPQLEWQVCRECRRPYVDPNRRELCPGCYHDYVRNANWLESDG